MDGEFESGIPSTSEIEFSAEKESLFCGTCRKQLPSKKSFDKHCERNHPGEKLVFDKCGKAFTFKILFEKHSKKNDCKTKNEKFTCQFCGMQVFLTNKLTHLRKHTGEKPFQCDACKRCFSSNSTLQEHILTHKGDKNHVCDVCQKRFMRKFHLLQHMQTHTDRNHPNNRNHVCHLCQRRFSLKDYLKRHLRTHTGEKPYICEVCFKSFATRGNLMSHCLIHTGEKPHSCDICNKTFRHLGGLRYHNIFVHSEPGCLPIHFCDVCGTSFKQKRAMLRHQKRHKKALKCNFAQIDSSLVDDTQDDAMLACDSSDKQFTSLDNLKAKNGSHPEHKPYVCHICQQCFTTEKSFQEHSDNHANKEITAISSSIPCDINSSGGSHKQDGHNHVEIKFICDVCDEQFANSDDLKIHFKTHMEQKYYVCDVCQLCFIDEDDLQNHQNTEKCVQFQTCKICGEKFVHKIELETHYRTHVGFANETTTSSSFNNSSYLHQQCSTISDVNIASHFSEKNHSGKDHSDVKNMPYICELCNKNFTCENDLKQHNVRHSEKRPHVCVLCLKNFDQKSELEAHICKYDNNKKKSKLSPADNRVDGHLCSVCLQIFRHYHEFQHHMFEHSKPYECFTCGKRFFTPDSLETHRLQSHKPFMHPCIVCKEKFLTKTDLIAHCFSHLGAGEYFICGTCKHCFKGRDELEKHKLSPCFVQPVTT